MRPTDIPCQRCKKIGLEIWDDCIFCPHCQTAYKLPTIALPREIEMESSIGLKIGDAPEEKIPMKFKLNTVGEEHR